MSIMSTDLQTVRQNQMTTAPADPLSDASPEWRQTLREAEKLAVATLTPKHLKVDAPADNGTVENTSRRRAAWQQTVANCILVANQARKWGADVFAVAAESYVVGNKLGYQGKLIAAVVNSRGGLTVPLKAMYSTGAGDAFAAVIYGKRDGDIPEDAWDLLEKYVDGADQAANRKLARLGVLTVRVNVGQCKTENKMWKEDPEQKLWYTGATKWARRHAPELMVGILSDDDLDRMKADQRIEQTTEQKRISALIPSSLDTSNFGVPVDSPEFRPEEKEPPFNPPTQTEVIEAQSIIEAQYAPASTTGTQDEADCLSSWRDILRSAESISDCNNLEVDLTSAPEKLRAPILELILARKSEIRSGRGARAE